MVEMTYDEIKAIKDSQTTVYTQPQADAQDTMGNTGAFRP